MREDHILRMGFVLTGKVLGLFHLHHFFRVVQVLYFKGVKGNSEVNPERREAPAAALIPMFIFVVLIVVVGIYPKLVTDVLNSAATEFLNRLDYIRSVLG